MGIYSSNDFSLPDHRQIDKIKSLLESEIFVGLFYVCVVFQ